VGNIIVDLLPVVVSATVVPFYSRCGAQVQGFDLSSPEHCLRDALYAVFRPVTSGLPDLPGHAVLRDLLSRQVHANLPRQVIRHERSYA
jgi:hypothetical protein